MLKKPPRMHIRATLNALACAFCGAAIATFLQLPAAAFIGATVAVFLAAFLRFKLQIPNALRNFSFTIIGATLGVGINPNFFTELPNYFITLFALTLSIIVTVFLSTLILNRIFAIKDTSAILAASPGTLTYTLALAAGNLADIRIVLILQSMRLLLITLLVIPILSLTNLSSQSTAKTLTTIDILPMNANIIILIFAAIIATGLKKLRVPVAWLLGGLIASAIAYSFSLASGEFNPWISFIGFTIAGAVIGARFLTITNKELQQFSIAGCTITAISCAVAITIGFITAHITNLPFAQMFIAFAPGGVEGMSTIAFALGYDPIFIAIHHIYRILLLIIYLPLCLLILHPNKL